MKNKTLSQKKSFLNKFFIKLIRKFGYEVESFFKSFDFRSQAFEPGGRPSLLNLFVKKQLINELIC